MKTPILGSSYVARSVNAADNRMVNLFPEIVPECGTRGRVPVPLSGPEFACHSGRWANQGSMDL